MPERGITLVDEAAELGWLRKGLEDLLCRYNDSTAGFDGRINDLPWGYPGGNYACIYRKYPLRFFCVKSPMGQHKHPPLSCRCIVVAID